MKRIPWKLGGITAAYIIFNLVASSAPIEGSLVMITFIISSTVYLALLLWEALGRLPQPKSSTSKVIREESEFDRLVRLFRACREASSDSAPEEVVYRVRNAYLERIRVRHGLSSEEANELFQNRRRLAQIVKGENLLRLLHPPVNSEGVSLETIDRAIEEIEAEAT
ncbi:MAG: hypothetical protein ACETV0_04615 [Nitrososphaeria archaeon]